MSTQDDTELLATMRAASAAPVVTVPPATLARLLVIAGYEGKAAHHAMLMDRREIVEVAGPNLTKLVREARAKMAGGRGTGGLESTYTAPPNT